MSLRCICQRARWAWVSNWRLAGASRRSLAYAYRLGWTTILSSYHLTTPQRTYGLSPVSFYGGTALEVYL